MSYLEDHHWRYATKKYDTSKKISAEDLNTLTEAIRLSASSYGLQPYKILVIEDADIREKLKAAAFGQTPITEASQLIVFASILDVGDAEIETYMKKIADVRELPLESLDGLKNMIKSKLSPIPEEQRNNWTAKQVYLALGNLLNAAAALRIDATPMEGFDPAAFDEILNLQEKGLHATVIATVGYRHAEDATQHQKKVRKSREEIFINL